MNACKRRQSFVSRMGFGIPLFCVGMARSQAQGFDISDWNLQFTPYLWASGVSGHVQIGRFEANPSASFAHILNHLNIGLMAAVEARNDRWGVLTDAIYVKLTDTRDTRTGGTIDLEGTALLYSLAGAYRVLPGPVSVDVLAGARYPYIRATITTALDSRAHTTSSWLPFVGTRVLAPIDEHWGVLGYIDGAKRGGNSDWQAIAGVSYKFNERVNGEFGYRYMHFNKHEDDAHFDIALHGPFAGARILF